MRLYHHPASTTSRIVMMYAAEERLDVDLQVVDLFTGEHLKPAYAAINPSSMVPVLEDGDFPLDRELDDPEVPRRQDRLARARRAGSTPVAFPTTASPTRSISGIRAGT